MLRNPEQPDVPLDATAPDVKSVPAVLSKFRKQENASSIWIRSLASLAMYLIIGYYIFPGLHYLLLITSIVLIHELGHFAAMKFFHYKDLGIFFIPLLGAYVSGSKRNISQKESAVILLAGPLPGMIIGLAFYFLGLQSGNSGQIAGIPFQTISLLFLLLNLFNLLPVYPLDGGQLLNRVFLNENNWLILVFNVLSAVLITWLALFGFQKPVYLLLIFPVLLLVRLFSGQKMTAIEKKIEEEGIHTDIDYNELTDEDYWRIRNILIAEYPPMKDIPPSPPYEYNEKEERIMNTIQGLLHRNLLQDLSVAGKLLILLLWLAALATPWLFKLEMSQFQINDFYTR